MIRVLFDGHQLGRRQTGNETYVREVLSRIRDVPDLEFVVAVERSLDLPEFLRPPVRVRRVPRNGIGRLGALTVLAHRFDVDLVHAIYFLPPVAARRSVVTIHDISFELFPDLFSRSALLRNRVLIRASARAAARIVTVSESSRRDILERYPVAEDRVVVIPNGVGPMFTPALEWEPYRGGRRLRILAVGTLEPRKNLLRLFEAVRRIHKDVEVELRVVGPSGFQADQIRGVLTGSISTTLLGWLSEAELAREYQGADLFVYPSIYEGFGLPVLEAMATGTPVVGSTGGSIPEIAGDAALLFDPLDVDALTEAIRRIAADGALASSLRLRGLKRAAAFSWEYSAAAHASLYRHLVAQ